MQEKNALTDEDIRRGKRRKPKSYKLLTTFCDFHPDNNESEDDCGETSFDETATSTDSTCKQTLRKRKENIIC